MSNHGKESTNKEGVNIDEMQTEIDMGKLITHRSEQTKFYFIETLHHNVSRILRSINPININLLLFEKFPYI
jgi:hypothetical protein